MRKSRAVERMLNQLQTTKISQAEFTELDEVRASSLHLDGYMAGLSGLQASQKQRLNDAWMIGHGEGLADRRTPEFAQYGFTERNFSWARARLLERSVSEGLDYTAVAGDNLKG